MPSLNRRDLFKAATAFAATNALPALPAAASPVDDAEAAGAPTTLSGTCLLYDHITGTMYAVGLALLSDSQGRSEIVVTSPTSGREERLVFARGRNWVPVHHLAGVIQDLGIRADVIHSMAVQEVA